MVYPSYLTGICLDINWTGKLYKISYMWCGLGGNTISTGRKGGVVLEDIPNKPECSSCLMRGDGSVGKPKLGLDTVLSQSQTCSLGRCLTTGP